MPNRKTENLSSFEGFFCKRNKQSLKILLLCFTSSFLARMTENADLSFVLNSIVRRIPTKRPTNNLKESRFLDGGTRFSTEELYLPLVRGLRRQNLILRFRKHTQLHKNKIVKMLPPALNLFFFWNSYRKWSEDNFTRSNFFMALVQRRGHRFFLQKLRPRLLTRSFILLFDRNFNTARAIPAVFPHFIQEFKSIKNPYSSDFPGVERKLTARLFT